MRKTQTYQKDYNLDIDGLTIEGGIDVVQCTISAACTYEPYVAATHLDPEEGGYSTVEQFNVSDVSLVHLNGDDVDTSAWSQYSLTELYSTVYKYIESRVLDAEFMDSYDRYDDDDGPDPCDDYGC